MPSPSVLQRLKERKLVHWGVAYLAGTWVLYEVTATVGGHWHLPDVFFRGLFVIIAIGFFVTLILAWYHGEKGRQRVSGPELLMVTALLIVASVALSTLRPQEDKSSSGRTRTFSAVEDERPSIAVLPFENFSPDPNDAYFADGMQEQLVSTLSRVEGLSVKGRTSVMLYREQPKPIPEIADEIGVTFILEGSARMAADQVVVTTQLIDARRDEHLWSKEYDRGFSVGDMVSVQRDIAQHVAEAVGATLTPEEQIQLRLRPTENTEAFSLYLRGRFFWNKSTEESFRRAIGYYEQALEEDPEYALAYAGLADSYNSLGWHDLLPSDEVYPKARAAAERALVIDETLPEAHASLAYVHQLYDWDWLAAEREYRRALELNPDYAEAHRWYAEYLSYMGRHEESLAEAKRAKELDPLSLGITHNLGLMHYDAGQYDQAVEQYRMVLEMDPDFAFTHNYLGLAHAGKGNFDDALAEVKTAIDLIEGQSALYLSTLGFVYASMGRAGEAEEILEQLLELSGHRYIAPVSLAIIYAALGQQDLAFEWMEKGYEVRDDFLMCLKVGPRFDSLRSDPRFQELLRRMGLED